MRLQLLGLIFVAFLGTPAPGGGFCLDDDLDTFAVCDGACTLDPGDQCGDCDDLDPDSFPGAPELCDGNDNSCLGAVPANEIDDDGDDWVECENWNDIQGDQPVVLGGGDCDDAASAVNPGAAEVCGNAIDDDCAGGDEVCPERCPDVDMDGHSICDGACVPDAGDVCGDCDDDDATSFPGAAEACDGSDNDCTDGVPGDETDDDADGYVECLAWNDTQGDQSEILGGGDCDDGDTLSFPGASEACDGNDNDCTDGVPGDETDDDADGYVECLDWNDLQGDQPAIVGGADCDDTTSAARPGATEICDTRDNDCDGATDEPDAEGAPVWYADGDADGFGNAADAQPACEQPSGFIADATDCNDGSAVTFPGAAPNDSVSGCLTDGDGDDYGDRQPVSGAQPGSDCDDADAQINPAAAEQCDGLDNDCDDETDEPDAVDAAVWFADADLDGFGDPGVSLPSCAPPAGFVGNATDCVDTSDLVFPGAAGRDSETACMADLDEDDYGDATPPAGAAAGSDCDDDDSTRFPGATPRCFPVQDYDCDDIDDEPICEDRDVNGDGQVDGVDLAWLGRAFGATDGDASAWWASVDYDQDGDVDGDDLALFVLSWNCKSGENLCQ